MHWLDLSDLSKSDVALMELFVNKITSRFYALLFGEPSDKYVTLSFCIQF